MKVLFLPYYDTNPYQDELARGLEEWDVSVETGDHTDPLPITQAILRGGRPDVLHLHWAHPLLVARSRLLSVLLGIRLLAEVCLARLWGIRVVWTVHNLYHHDRPDPPVERPFRRAIARISDEVIVHGPSARERVVEEYGFSERDPVAVPHGNYVDYYENRVSRAEARAKLGIDDDAFVFLYIGNVRPYKNVPELVDTFRGIEAADARLLVAGIPPADDGVRADLVDRCRRDDRVRGHLEFVPDDEIQHYMNAADAVVFPFSDVLTSGSVLLGMSFGRPVVAPRLGTVPDALGPTDDLLYDPDDPDGLERALGAALERDLDSLGERTLARARQFDWLTVGAQTAAVYYSALDHRATTVGTHWNEAMRAAWLWLE